MITANKRRIENVKNLKKIIFRNWIMILCWLTFPDIRPSAPIQKLYLARRLAILRRVTIERDDRAQQSNYRQERNEPKISSKDDLDLNPHVLSLKIKHEQE